MYTRPFLLSGVTVVPFNDIFPARNSTKYLLEDPREPGTRLGNRAPEVAILKEGPAVTTQRCVGTNPVIRETRRLLPRWAPGSTGKLPKPAPINWRAGRLGACGHLSDGANTQRLTFLKEINLDTQRGLAAAATFCTSKLVP